MWQSPSQQLASHGMLACCGQSPHLWTQSQCSLMLCLIPATVSVARQNRRCQIQSHPYLLNSLSCLHRHRRLLNHNFGAGGHRGNHPGSSLPVGEVGCLACSHSTCLCGCVHAAFKVQKIRGLPWSSSELTVVPSL